METRSNICFLTRLILLVTMVHYGINQKDNSLPTPFERLNAILVEIDENISKESKILSGLKFADLKDTQGQANQGHDNIKDVMLLRTNTKYDLLSTLPANRQGSVVRQITTNDLIVSVPVLPIEQFSDLPPGWPISNQSFAQKSSPVPSLNRTVHPIKQRMFETMDAGFGCSYAFMTEILLQMVGKTNRDLDVLLQSFGKTLLRMANNGDLNCYGSSIVRRLKMVWAWSTVMSAEFIHQFTKKAYYYFKLRGLDTDVENVILDYDKFYNAVEGNKLFNTALQFNNFSLIIHGHEEAEYICDNIITALKAPADRLFGTLKLRSWINNVNRVHAKYFPNTRRSDIDRVIDALIEIGSNLPFHELSGRRRMQKKGRHIKSEYKKMIRHLILKHSKLFRKFVEHYKHRHGLRQKYHSSHHPHHNRRHKHHRSKNLKIENTTEIQETSPLPEKYENVNFKPPSNNHVIPPKRYSVVTEITQAATDISVNHYSSNYTEYQFSPSFTPNATYHENTLNSADYYSSAPFYKRELFQKHILPSILSRRNMNDKFKVFHENYTQKLEKITDETSYSDEETNLKTMLRYAFIHMNNNVSTI